MSKETKILLRSFAELLVGALLGGVLCAILMANRWWEKPIYHWGIGAVVGAVTVGFCQLRRLRDFAWSLVFGAFAGAIIGAFVPRFKHTLALEGAIVGLLAGAICGTILELRKRGKAK